MDFILDGIRAAFGLLLAWDRELAAVVGVSLTVSSASTLFAAIIGIPTGFFIAVNEFRGKGGVITVLNTLLALPTVVIGLFVYALISRQGIFGPLDLLYSRTAIVIGQVILIAPVVTTFVVSAVGAVDDRYHKTALTLGASPVDAGLAILREARFGVVAAVLLAFGRVIAEVGISMMLGGNIRGATRTMTTALALEYDKGDFALSIALGMVLLLVSLSVNALFGRVQGRIRV